MTRPGTEPRSPGPLANTLTARPMSGIRAIMEVTKNNYSVNGEGAIDHDTVTRVFKKFYSGCKDLDDQAKSGMPNSVASEVMLKAIEANLVSVAFHSPM